MVSVTINYDEQAQDDLLKAIQDVNPLAKQFIKQIRTKSGPIEAEVDTNTPVGTVVVRLEAVPNNNG